MSFLKKLTNLFQSTSASREYWLNVRCSKCGEEISNRVDLYNDLSIVYGEGGGDTYFCRKVLIGGGRCFQPVEVKLTFDAKRRLLAQEISGGEFIAAED